MRCTALLLLASCGASSDTAAPADVPPGDTDAATNTAGDTDTDTDTTITPPEAGPLEICINEFMANNDSSWVDDRGLYPDWIELHNPGVDSLELKGWSLTDDPDTPGKARLDDLVIDGGSFLVLAADGQAQLGPIHLEFQLNSDGDTVALFRGDGAGEVVHFGPLTDDAAQARHPDCGPLDSFEPEFRGTPGASNE